jgi:DNA-binding MarR family transcriptional regulator
MMQYQQFCRVKLACFCKTGNYNLCYSNNGNYLPVMDRENLDRNFGFLAHDVARLMRVAFDRRGRELGLTRSQWWVLTALYALDGAPQSTLADFMDVEKATLGRLIDQLEDKGWVERRPDLEDRRVKRVYLTAKVQSVMRSLRTIASELRKDALAGLSDSEHEAFLNALMKVKMNLLRMTDTQDEIASDSAKVVADD